jgi:hypothetical protein
MVVTVDIGADLRRQIAAKQVVCFVGAGVSAASVTNGSDVLWTALIESGARWVENVQPVLPARWLDERLRALASDDLDDLLAVASQVASKLRAPSGGEYAEWLHRAIGQLTVSDAGLIQAIGALEVPIVTTNYDHLLEQVLGREAVSWHNEAAVDRILRGDSNAILHLHGHYTEPESVVLGLWEYAGLVNNEHTQAVLRALGMAKSLLFIGFGAGLHDPNFRQFLRWLRRVSETNPYRHYRLVRASELVAAQKEHDPAERVMVLSYGNEFADLKPYVRSLVPSRRRDEDSVRFAVEIDKTSATALDPAQASEPAGADALGGFREYDELGHLEHELDERMVGEFTVLDILKKAAVERADWSKRSARSLMTTLKRSAADLIDETELDHVFGWLIVYGVLRFQGIDRWWNRKHDWEHAVDLTEIAVRGKHLLNALGARSSPGRR